MTPDVVIYTDGACSGNPGPGGWGAVMTAGAYGAVQSGTYNTRPLVPEVLVRGADYAVVRPRPTYDEMIDRDKVPGWVKG